MVLGDPIQEIFSWNGPHPHWDRDVCSTLAAAGQLAKPWCWIRAGAEGFGEWLLDVRQILLAGGQIDLRAAPLEVGWIELDCSYDDAR